jgi:hypothetical protein
MNGCPRQKARGSQSQKQVEQTRPNHLADITQRFLGKKLGLEWVPMEVCFFARYEFSPETGNNIKLIDYLLSLLLSLGLFVCL